MVQEVAYVTLVTTPLTINCIMQTRSSPTGSDSDGPSQLSASKVDLTSHVQWTEQDEAALIAFLITHKAEGGDGLNFKQSFWTAAAEHMKQHTTKGGPKVADKCKAKWARVGLRTVPVATDATAGSYG